MSAPRWNGSPIRWKSRLSTNNSRRLAPRRRDIKREPGVLVFSARGLLATKHRVNLLLSAKTFCASRTEFGEEMKFFLDTHPAIQTRPSKRALDNATVATC